jgi:TolB-like protein/class 3 adenylate cyclase
LTDDAPVTRRLAAIVAAEVVGFSRLVGSDENGTLAALRAIRRDIVDPQVSKFGGRIFKTTGDGVLAEFPSAVMALEAAIGVQEKMLAQRPPKGCIELRIGIHAGDVVVEGEDLLGDGVNVAARLEAMAEPGGICISARVHEDTVGRIAIEARDMGELSLKNIARSVRAYAVIIGGRTANLAPSPPKRAQGAPRLSMVVLPFDNISGDHQQEYFVDGVTESLTTDLSRIRGSFVIGRNTAFTYKGKAVDLTRIGRELNVRYVLEGSVQRGGDRMRINVQLIEAETGSHLWAERFDKPIADLFDMQDEIVARLASALNAELIAAEARRGQRAASPDSLDLYFQGRALLNKGWTPEYLMRARKFFERANEVDPGNLDAIVGAAAVDAIFLAGLMTDKRAALVASAEAAVSKVLSIAPDFALGHLVLGSLYAYSNRAEKGVAECERALMLDRNLAVAHNTIGFAKYASGRASETEAHILAAISLSPRDTLASFWLTTVGLAELSLGADEKAAAWLSRAVEANRNFPLSHFLVAAALRRLGREKEAHEAVQAGLLLEPTFSCARWRGSAASDNSVYLSSRERICEDMQKAGVPEG